MGITVEYNPQMVFMSQLEIEDLGNFCIRCTNDFGIEHYFLVRTSLGKTYFLKFGGAYPDLDLITDTFTVEYKKVNYKESTIVNEVTKFINDGKKLITNIEVITLEEATNCFPNITEIYKDIE